MESTSSNLMESKTLRAENVQNEKKKLEREEEVRDWIAQLIETWFINFASTVLSFLSLLIHNPHCFYGERIGLQNVVLQEGSDVHSISHLQLFQISLISHSPLFIMLLLPSFVVQIFSFGRENAFSFELHTTP